MRVETDTDIVRLQRALRDLVALSAIPAVWTGRDPPAVAAGLADALVALLQLDFAFVRLSDPGGGRAVDVTRGNAWKQFPEWLERHAAPRVPVPGRTTVADVGEGSQPCRGVAIPIGLDRDAGLVAAASARSDFPTAIEQLVLSLAANKAATDFQNARLTEERRRAEEELRAARDELEVKVAERTAELRLANDELSALRRVATLVAEGVQPEDLFAVVAEEIAGVVDVPLVRVARYEPDGTATECAGFSTQGSMIPLGTRISLEGMSVLRLVRESSEAARIDDYAGLAGEIAELTRRAGIRSAVAIPIVVAGHVWGAVVASSTEQPLPLDTEQRLEKFSQLVATAIANAQSRSELAASRRRIVAASDEARRKIERDLHDGTQQRLVSLGLLVREAEANVPADMGNLRAELSGIATGLSGAVADLQELSRGIHPAVLSHGGLGPALRTLARRSTIPVALEVTTDTRLPEPIEVAAYFVASEALANATKHAQASCIEISLATRDGRARLSIRDDGVGGADPAGGSGLVGLCDRVEALGGSIRVRSSPGEGTHITAELPLEQEDGSRATPVGRAGDSV